MESILVTTENLERQATNVDTEANGYMEKYNELLNDVDTFTSTDWTGDDATAFKNKVKEFEPQFKKMKELMEKYATYLRTASSTYENTQQDVISQINGLNNSAN
ncbi:WXG100 family type VII secretion target [Lachnospiraceae bacterium RM5]|nr:WXG100 family type VII secretion target [Lachnospiraceae bacterium RM5]